MPAEKKSVVIKAEVKKHEKPNAEKKKAKYRAGDWMRTVFMVFWAVEKYLCFNIVKQNTSEWIIGDGCLSSL